MGQPCTVCASPYRVAIDEGLVAGRPAHALGQLYSCGERAIQRHKKAHLTAALTALAQKRAVVEERRAGTLLDRIRNLVEILEDLVRTSREDGSFGQLLAASRELRASYEFEAKLSGEIAPTPTTVVNVLSSPEVTTLVTVLIGALAPYPEARIAAARALTAIEVDVEVLG